MKMIWYQRADGLWNAACMCNASVCGISFERRADAEGAHVDLTRRERSYREHHSAYYVSNQIPPCGPKLPEPNPNDPTPLVFP